MRVKHRQVPAALLPTVTVIATLLSWSRSVDAQSFAPYSDFQAMTAAELATLQVKLTYLGIQFGMVNTVMFGVSETALDVNLFMPYHHGNRIYVNDAVGQAKFAATVGQLKALIDDAGTLPEVTDGGVDSGAVVSFSLLNTAGGTTKAFESIVSSANGKALFEQLLLALASNARAIRVLRGFGCDAGVLPPTPPADMQGQVAVASSGLRRDRHAPDEYVGKVRVKNTSAATIPAPLILVAVIHSDANLLGADGETCNIRPAGHPFINLVVSGGLSPGATVERTLRFANAGDGKLNVSYKVVAGAGTP